MARSKRDFERLFNELLGVEVQWRKLDSKELEQLAKVFNDPNTLLARLKVTIPGFTMMTTSNTGQYTTATTPSIQIEPSAQPKAKVKEPEIVKRVPRAEIPAIGEGQIINQIRDEIIPQIRGEVKKAVLEGGADFLKRFKGPVARVLRKAIEGEPKA